MMVRLKNLHDAACRNIRSLGKFSDYEKYSDRNDAIMTRLFNELVEKKIDGIRYVDDTYFKYYHRSTREGVLVQYSEGFYKKGKLYPCCHANLNSPKDLLKEGYPTGWWETIVA